jgi:hypothetical protein
VAAGVTQLLNRAYVVCKHAPEESLARRRLTRFGRYKLLQYMTSVHTPYGRDRVRGAARALDAMPALLAAKPEDLATVYAQLRDDCMTG